jgi:hypothetical protein
VLPVDQAPGESAEKAKARASLSPAVNAAAAADAYQGNVLGKDADLAEIVDTLQAMMRRANGGDLTDLENMLIGQANALQTMFVSLARRAHAQQFQRHFEGFLALALKCQSQSRATVQAVIDLKYPRQATFVKQANIANGPQQVNNASERVEGTSTRARAGERPSARQNELLGVRQNEVATGGNLGKHARQDRSCV